MEPVAGAACVIAMKEAMSSSPFFLLGSGGYASPGSDRMSGDDGGDDDDDDDSGPTATRYASVWGVLVCSLRLGTKGKRGEAADTRGELLPSQQQMDERQRAGEKQGRGRAAERERGSPADMCVVRECKCRTKPRERIQVKGQVRDKRQTRGKLASQRPSTYFKRQEPGQAAPRAECGGRRRGGGVKAWAWNRVKVDGLMGKRQQTDKGASDAAAAAAAEKETF